MKYDPTMTHLENHVKWGIAPSDMVAHNVFTTMAEHILKHNPEEIHILFDFDIDRSQYGGKDDPMVTLVKILSGNATEYQIKKYHKLANPTLSKKLHDIYKYERELYLKHHPELAA